MGLASLGTLFARIAREMGRRKRRQGQHDTTGRPHRHHVDAPRRTLAALLTSANCRPLVSTNQQCCRFDPFSPSNMRQNEQIRGSSFLPSARRTSARQGRGWRESACTDLNLWLHPRERRRGGCWCYRSSDTLPPRLAATNTTTTNLTNTTTTTSAVHPVPWSEQGPDSLFIRTPSALRGRLLPHNSSVWPPPPPPVGKSRKISFQH